MANEDRDKVIKKDEEPDVEAHKLPHVADDPDSDDEGPDVEGHMLHKKVEK
jgi:hypothetical protein